MNILHITQGEEQKAFEKIANTLINQFTLHINGLTIELCDLEFYWNDSKEHKDKSTHPHKYTNGQLRPHGSGYDIALRNEQGFGGILIRGVIKDGAATYGPIRCADVIFKSGDNLFDNGLTIKLIERDPHPRKNYIIFPTKRVGLKKEGKFWDRDYRFIACREDYLQQIDGKETICKAIEQTVSGIDPEIIRKALATRKKK